MDCLSTTGLPPPQGSTGPDPRRALLALRAVRRHLAGAAAGQGPRRIVHLVSYPRSGSTLLRTYLSLLTGRPQASAYPDDVVDAGTPALTRALDQVEVVKSHQLPTGEGDLVYLLRDGRNATLSFLYLHFLSGSHGIARLDELCEGIRRLDAGEGSWAGHVAAVLAERGRRRILFIRYEDMMSRPRTAIARLARFLGADLADREIADCLSLGTACDGYFAKPLSGYRYSPAPGSIWDLLKRHRTGDYWRYIFDDATRRHFHESGGTAALLRFGYERSADWWREGSARPA